MQKDTSDQGFHPFPHNVVPQLYPNMVMSTGKCPKILDVYHFNVLWVIQTSYPLGIRCRFIKKMFVARTLQNIISGGCYIFLWKFVMRNSADLPKTRPKSVGTRKSGTGIRKYACILVQFLIAKRNLWKIQEFLSLEKSTGKIHWEHNVILGILGTF